MSYEKVYQAFLKDFREAEGVYSEKNGYSKTYSERMNDLKAVIESYKPKFSKLGYEIDFGAGGVQIFPKRKK